MLFTETPDISNIQAAWLPLLYAGLLSCVVGYTLQIVGQKGINPVIASLIISLESVISDGNLRDNNCHKHQYAA